MATDKVVDKPSQQMYFVDHGQKGKKYI